MSLKVLAFLKEYWIVIVIALAGAFLAKKCYDAVYQVGYIAASAEYEIILKTKAEEDLKQSKKIKELTDKLTKTNSAFGQALADAINKADSEYQRGLEDGKKEPAAIIAEYAAANKRLSIDLKRAKGIRCNPTDAGDNSTTDGGYVTERAELSDEASGFLIGEAQRADKVVKQLTACQAVVNGYYNSLLRLVESYQELEATKK